MQEWLFHTEIRIWKHFNNWEQEFSLPDITLTTLSLCTRVYYIPFRYQMQTNFVHQLIHASCANHYNSVGSGSSCGTEQSKKSCLKILEVQEWKCKHLKCNKDLLSWFNLENLRLARAYNLFVFLSKTKMYTHKM